MARASLWVLLLCVLTLALWCGLSSADCSGNGGVFSVHPVDQSGSEGEMVIFHCEYSGTPNFFVWEFFPVNGKRLTVGDSVTIPYFQINTTNGDLIISNLESNHTGCYACRATPSPGCFVFSDNATLTVTGTPTVSVTANSYTANATGQVEISGLVQGHPLATVQLQVLDDGVAVEKNDPRVNITQPSDESPYYRILFSDLTTGDGGSYRVQAVNSEGSRYQTVSLSVIGPDLPILTINTSPFVIKRFSTDVRVTCSVQPSADGSDSGLAMKWRAADNTVVEDGMTGEREIVLNLGTFEESEQGAYTCTACNVRGSGSPVTVHVYAPISLEGEPVVEKLEDNKIRVSWQRPTPPPNVPIYKYVVHIKRDESLFLSHRTTATNFTTDSLPAGEYDVSVGVILGTSGSDEGTQVSAVEQISLPAPPPPSSSTVSPSPTPSPSPSLSSSPLPSSSSSSSSPLTSTPTSPTISATSPNFIDPTEPESSSVSLVVIVAAVVGGVVILILTGIAIALFFLCYYYPHKRKLSSQQQSWSKEERLDETDQTLGNSYEPLTLTLPPHSELPPSPTSPNNLMAQYFNMDIDPKWEFPRENLQLSEVLCESQYSILYKGSAKGIKDKPLEVSIKALRDGATEEDVKILFYEMDQLASIGPHPNIVSLLRCCTVGKPLYMVTEYMSHGDLLGFLRASRGHYSMYTVSPGFRNQQPPCLQLSSRDLLSIGSKVANGMRFLADRKIVHRALCCKNILVGAGMDIKVYNIGGYDLPAEVRDPLIKWMAPEVLAENNFSSHSDAWAFGVTLWELVTVGATPYAEINPDDLFSQLYSGMRMPRPLHCAQEVYEIMITCWEFHPASRPHFATIHDRLDNLAHSKMSMLNLRNYNDMEYSQFDEFPSQATAL